MTYRPYPNRIRALKQIEKNRFPLVRARVTADGGTIIESVGGKHAPRCVVQPEYREPIRYVVGLGRDIGDIRDMTEDEVATLRQKCERPVGSEETTP